MDGMTAYNTDVQATLDRCKEIVGDNDSRITVDIIQVSSPEHIMQWDHKPTMNAFKNLKRKRTLRNTYIGSDVIETVKRAHPDVHWRHSIVQTDKIEGADELNFSQEIVGPLIEGGKQDAKKALENMKMADDIATALAAFLQ